MTVQTTEMTYQNFINNQWIASTSEDLIASINPANSKEKIGYVQNSTREDVDHAVKAAKHAKKTWRQLSGAERGNYLYKIADVMERRHEEIAETLTKEMGKTLPEAKGETSRGIAILRYYAGEGMRETGDVIPASNRKALMYTDRVPLGVVGIITPWNFPVAIPVWKMAPALIYGNTVVIKPAQEAAVTAAKVIECMEEAGLPEGVVNLVTGRGSIVGQGIIDHPDVNGITFTGSNSVGKSVAEGAVARGAKYQLEMGGKNPIIIADDADLDEAVEATISGGLRSTGQKCTATSRVIVQEGIYAQFKEKLLQRTREITIGNGMDDDIWMGPCVNEAQLDTVLSYIEKGKTEGATLLLGGDRPKDPELENGFYVNPTIFEDVRPGMTIAQEEIFGPVLSLLKVSTIEEALEVANDVPFGLSASIFTKNTDNMFEFIDEMEAGLVRVNFETAGVELQAPFGGVKDSSYGPREQGSAAKEFFTSIKTVYIKP
ncbi:alpha-ketoglutaric semialdehyde dehydrogenase GucD [Thalassobacillus pellis]|uniref:alpha-ketoglutaric semialdehyde dehydrogenase GucD n=1 Tax=Thalassobacillus pellis TaxID=748008 RepID=UPI00195F6BC8|nr:alpha-ketoglutaric semialdehyde dehydrogenase GucD [Thalassobacillus pellis]MBM7551605.1 aldehyde dehydrogenase (NAD+) [Thalassobacillus pellis]